MAQTRRNLLSRRSLGSYSSNLPWQFVVGMQWCFEQGGINPPGIDSSLFKTPLHPSSSPDFKHAASYWFGPVMSWSPLYRIVNELTTERREFIDYPIESASTHNGSKSVWGSLFEFQGKLLHIFLRENRTQSIYSIYFCMGLLFRPISKWQFRADIF